MSPLHAQTSEVPPLSIDGLPNPSPSALRSFANSNTVTVLTGGERKSHINLVSDLANVLNTVDGGQFTLRVIPHLGNGGRQNALDILYLKGVDMAVIQTDVLAHLRGESPIFYRNVDQQVRYITQLHREQWHVIASRDIKKLSDLKGKTVNISAPYSSNFITSKTILELLGTKAKYSTLSDSVALAKLRSGEIDAITVLAAAPSVLLQQIKEEDGLHIVPTNFYEKSIYEVPFKPALEHFYLPAALQHEDYPNLIPQGQIVPSVSASTVLAVYNWPEGSERHRRVKKFVESFFSNLSSFYQPGRYAKWREVNIAAEVPGWRRYGAAAEVLQEIQSSKVNNTVSVSQTQLLEFEAFKAFLASDQPAASSEESLSAEQEQELYKRFLKWREATQ